MVVIQGCYTKPTNDNAMTYYQNDVHNNNCNNNKKEIKKIKGIVARAACVTIVV